MNHQVRTVVFQSRRLASGGPNPLRPVLNQVEKLKPAIPSLIGYGSAAGLMGLYFIDWKLVMQYVPFYGGKFSE